MRAMVNLAMLGGNGPVFLNTIAKNQGISRNYLDALFSNLHMAGLVRSVRGASGGYILNRDPSQISALDIVTALEGKPVLVDCLENRSLCERTEHCATRDLWMKLRTLMEQTLAETQLSDLVASSRKKEHQSVQMYYI
jgi:Rrf2 family protein